MRNIRLAVVATVAFAAIGCFGADTPCTLLARSATSAQADLLHLLDEHDASHRDDLLHAGRAAERLLYIAATCPAEFSRSPIPESDFFIRWKAALESEPTLQRDERTALVAGVKAALHKDTAMARKANELMASVSAVPPRGLKTACGATFRHMLIGLSDDWMARSGALWFSYSDTLLFMLTACPEDAYYVLDQRPEMLASWLRDLSKASFWGIPEGLEQRRGLQRALVHLLQGQQTPKYLTATHDEILRTIRDLCVTAVDETTPCETGESKQ